jgi:hypothetical protein
LRYVGATLGVSQIVAASGTLGITIAWIVYRFRQMGKQDQLRKFGLTLRGDEAAAV